MKNIRSIVVSSLAFLFAMTFAFVALAEDNSASNVVKRWMPERPMSVAVVDLQALKIKSEWLKTKEFFKTLYPRTLSEPNELTDVLSRIENGMDVFESQVDKFGAVGGNKAYIFVDSFNNSFGCKTPFIVVIPTDKAKSKEAKKLAAQFVQGDFVPEEQREEWQKSLFVKAYKDCIVLAPVENVSGNKDAFFEQLNVYTAYASASRDQKLHVDLFNRMAEGKNSAVQVYLFPNGAFSRVLENANRKAARAGLAHSILYYGIQAVCIELDLSAENRDLRLQVFSKDAQSAKALFKALPTLKSMALENIDSIPALEQRLFTTDLINQAFYLLTPELKDNTLNWSAKNVIKRLEELLPKFELDRTAGLYAPVTDDVKEEADRIYSLVAPFINKQTAAVVHFDTADLDGSFECAGQKVYDELKRLFPETFSGKSLEITQRINYVEMILEDIDELLSQVHAIGGRDVYLVLSKDMASSLKIIVPFDKEKKTDAQKLFYCFRQMRFLSPQDVSSMEDMYFRVFYKNSLVFGVKNNRGVSKNDFIQNLKGFEAEDVPEIRQAFEISWKYQRENKSTALSRIQAVVNVQGLWNPLTTPVFEPTRDRLEEEDPELAELLPEFTDQELADGVKVVALEIHPDKLFANLHVISKDEQSAQKFAEFVKKLKPFVVQSYSRYSSDPSTPFSPALMKAYYQDYVDTLFDSRVMEVQGSVLSIRANNIPEKYQALNSWFSKHGSVATIGAAGAGVVVALFIPAVQSARESARNLSNVNNLKQMALGMLVYEQARMHLPLPYTKDADGKPLHSWRVALLPYFEEQELYDKIRLDEPWDSEWNRQFHDKCPKIYKNPNVELAPDETTYAVVVGENTAFPGAKRISLARIHDGCSNTAMIVERSPVCWMDPNSDIPFEEAVKGVNVSPDGIRSYFRGVFSAVMCDGAVRTFPENVSSAFLRKLFEINDQQIIRLEEPELDDN